MKKILFILVISVIVYSCANKEVQVDITDEKIPAIAAYDSTDATNDLFDNAPVKELLLNKVFIGGEIEDSGFIDFDDLEIRSKLVKETILFGADTSFTGAYRYEGYSLHDILNRYLLKKKNSDKFKPFVDVYVEVENDKGEKAVFSWGEIFYPNDRHEILLATKVMRIIPVKSHDMWPLPDVSRVVVAGDLFTHRNISNPIRITVKSHDIDLLVKKGLTPLYSDVLYMTVNNTLVDSLKNMTENNLESIHTIFYGRGRGIHSTQSHQGIYLKEYLKNYIECTPEAIKHGNVVIAAADGYRAVFSYSEISNRNDQSEVLLMCNPDLKDKGIFRILPSGDFFSDRAVKGITGIYYYDND